MRGGGHFSKTLRILDRPDQRANKLSRVLMLKWITIELLISLPDVLGQFVDLVQ